ncbi:hypothetical protein, partial [Streptococcus pseudopneumoniae]
LKNSKITPKLHIQHLNEIKEQRNPLSRKGVAALLYFLSDKVGIITHSGKRKKSVDFDHHKKTGNPVSNIYYRNSPLNT